MSLNIEENKEKVIEVGKKWEVNMTYFEVGRCFIRRYNWVIWLYSVFLNRL